MKNKRPKKVERKGVRSKNQKTHKISHTKTQRNSNIFKRSKQQKLPEEGSNPQNKLKLEQAFD